MDLAGKSVLITGASSGIGAALAKNLVQRGARLALLARRAERLQQVAASCKASNPIITVVADIRAAEDVRSAIETAVNGLGRLDVVVNNAGQGYFGPLEDMQMSDFDAVVKTNLYGLMHVTQATLPYLKQSKGLILNVSSALSKRAIPFLAAYAGSKSMVDALSDGLRVELMPYGIRVLTYCPPETETEFHANARKRPGLDPEMGRRKFKKADDVAEGIAQAIIHEKREVNEGRSLEWMAFLAPRLVDKMFAGMVKKQLP